MAKQATVLIYLAFKVLELGTLILWTGLMFGSGLWLIDKIQE